MMTSPGNETAALRSAFIPAARSWLCRPVCAGAGGSPSGRRYRRCSQRRDSPERAPVCGPVGRRSEADGRGERACSRPPHRGGGGGGGGRGEGGGGVGGGGGRGGGGGGGGRWLWRESGPPGSCR